MRPQRMLHGCARGFQHDAVQDVGLAHRERRHAGQVQHHLQDHKARHDHGGAAGIEACRAAALYRKSILEEIGTFDENFFAYFEDVDLSWRANNAGYKCVLCPTAKCYHICGASTGAVKYNAFKSQQSGRNSILLPLKNEPLLMLILNFLPLALGYLLKCYKFHKQGFGEAWDKGMHEAFALLKEGRLGKRPFRLKDLPNYILMELWMIWNMVPYLWYRLVVVRFDLK